MLRTRGMIQVKNWLLNLIPMSSNTDIYSSRSAHLSSEELNINYNFKENDKIQTSFWCLRIICLYKAKHHKGAFSVISSFDADVLFSEVMWSTQTCLHFVPVYKLLRAPVQLFVIWRLSSASIPAARPSSRWWLWKHTAIQPRVSESFRAKKNPK